jgi:DNA-binding CsgD family transcriptional regulator
LGRSNNLTLSRFDPVAVVEAAYEGLEAPTDRAWLARALAALSPVLARVGPPLVFTYRIAGGPSVQVVDLLGDALAPAVATTWRAGVAAMSPEMAQQCFLRGNAGTLSQLAVAGEARREDFALYQRAMAPHGSKDGVGVAACDAEGWGFNATWLLPDERRVNDRQRVRLGRLIVHFATAFRLRRRLRGPRATAAPDAVLRPDGTLVHAEGAARSRQSRDLLRRSVAALDRARGPMRRSDADRALAGARWSLVDSFESDGRRYVVARENDCRVGGGGALTRRERQIVEHARLGQSSKVIAYTLGISDSTVRVFLARAYAKLGIKGRAQLLTRPL